MKIGFSSLVCPDWELETIISRAAEMGFDGVELFGLCREMHLPRVPELARDPERVRQKFRDGHIDLICLGTSASLASCQQRVIDGQRAIIAEYLELAAKLECPYVRICAGEIQEYDYQRLALSRVAAEITSLIPLVTHHNVTLLVENGGDFPGSDALWFIIDAAGHPAVQACWSQHRALTIGERPTTSIPRLSGRIGTVHICDAEYDPQGVPTEYKLPGRGQVEVARQIELLKGLGYDGYLIHEWPKASIPSLPEPDKVLPEVAAFLRECVEARQAELTAYKGDKRKPKLATRAPALANE